MNKHGAAIFQQVSAGLILSVIFYLVYRFRLKAKTPAKTVDTVVQQEIKKKFSVSNQAILNTLHPAVKDQFENFLLDIEKLGYTPVLTAGYRTFQRSAELKKEDPRNASPGYSSHNYGMAVDLVLQKGKTLIQKNATKAAWEATGVPDLAKKKYGMRWGGDFAGYADNVHFDFQNKYPTDALLAKATKQFGSVDKIIGNEVRIV